MCYRMWNIDPVQTILPNERSCGENHFSLQIIIAAYNMPKALLFNSVKIFFRYVFSHTYEQPT